MFCLTEDNVKQIQSLLSIVKHLNSVATCGYVLRSMPLMLMQNTWSFTYFQFSSYRLASPPPSNPTVFLASFSASSHPFAFFAAICLLWLEYKWVMSWKTSFISPVFPGIFSCRFTFLVFSTVIFLKFLCCLELPLNGEGVEIRKHFCRGTD